MMGNASSSGSFTPITQDFYGSQGLLTTPDGATQVLIKLLGSGGAIYNEELDESGTWVGGKGGGYVTKIYTLGALPLYFGSDGKVRESDPSGTILAATAFNETTTLGVGDTKANGSLGGGGGVYNQANTPGAPATISTRVSSGGIVDGQGQYVEIVVVDDDPQPFVRAAGASWLQLNWT